MCTFVVLDHHLYEHLVEGPAVGVAEVLHLRLVHHPGRLLGAVVSHVAVIHGAGPRVLMVAI